MPVKSTASKSVTAPKARKTRTRKTNTRTAKAVATPQKYLKDISTRWAIHNYEIQELVRDFTKGFEAVKPYHAQLVKMVNK